MTDLALYITNKNYSSWSLRISPAQMRDRARALVSEMHGGFARAARVMSDEYAPPTCNLGGK